MILHILKDFPSFRSPLSKVRHKDPIWQSPLSLSSKINFWKHQGNNFSFSLDGKMGHVFIYFYTIKTKSEIKLIVKEILREKKWHGGISIIVLVKRLILKIMSECNRKNLKCPNYMVMDHCKNGLWQKMLQGTQKTVNVLTESNF